MAAKSKLEKYREEITDLVCNKGTSIRSAWKIINYNLPEEAKVSNNTFFHFVKKHIINEKPLEVEK